MTVGDPLVLAEEETNLTATDADVTGRDVGVLTEMAVELGHERLAEPHDLTFGGVVRIEVRAALGTTNRHTGQRILEDLLETEELDGSQVHRGVESQSALVRPQYRRVLDTEATVDAHLALVIDPRDPEDDLTLRFADTRQDCCLDVLRVLLEHRAEGLEDLPHGLVELGLSRIALQHCLVGVLELAVHPATSFMCRRPSDDFRTTSPRAIPLARPMD